MPSHPDFADALNRACANSPFLERLIETRPKIEAALRTGDPDAALALARAQGAACADISEALRVERGGVALTVAIADLAGAWDLSQVTRTLSDFADRACSRAVEAAITERCPDAAPQGFAIVALGKHGGRELNYSSDIDPIFLYDRETLPTKEGEEPAKAAVRIGRRVLELLQDLTVHGYVFRVDLRLRPTPEVSPIALPIAGAISHYESSAMAWEQAAFIRARAAAGDIALGQRFLDAIRPFIWRRSLDFGQIRNIDTMRRSIRDHYSAGQAIGPGYDCKRGRGGIRECEFFVQAQQLIHGGRDEALRSADTRTALSALVAAGHVPEEDGTAIGAAYVALRTAEHRLQMLHDRQTHEIPKQAGERDAAARLHGLSDGDAFVDWIKPHTARVDAIYSAFADWEEPQAPTLPLDDDQLDETLESLGLAAPIGVARLVRRWRSGKLRAIRSERAREGFEAVLPSLLTTIAAAPDPSRALARLDSMFERLPSAINFFDLLLARPALIALLGDLLSLTPVLADQLARRADLIDRLLEPDARSLPGTVETLIDTLRPPASLDYERVLDYVRAEVGEVRFLLGAQLIDGSADPLATAEGYARLAEAACRLLADAAVAEFERTHGKVPGVELAILALGRLGGRQLTHASDLDLIFLFVPSQSGDVGERSDGRRVLGATDYFNRLSQRVIAALSVPTATGALYEVDTRLRPSGAQGPPCVSLAQFARYQREDAWTWEHMALTRARPIYGSTAAREALQAVLGDVLHHPAGPDLADDVRSMRSEIAVHKQPSGPLDVKRLPGGLIDAEFLLHFHQLSSKAGFRPELAEAADALATAGLLDPDVADALRFLTRLLVLVRLVAPDCAEPPPPARALMARSLELDGWDAVMDRLAQARASITAAWEKALGPRGEIKAKE